MLMSVVCMGIFWIWIDINYHELSPKILPNFQFFDYASSDDGIFITIDGK